MLDTTMYIPPKDTKKMRLVEIAAHAVHWTEDVAGELLCIAAQMIPCSYVQIRREPSTGDEWLHYGTRWLNADVTDTKVKLAPRPERLQEEKRVLHDAQRQINELEIICQEQQERIRNLDGRVWRSVEMSCKSDSHTSGKDAGAHPVH